MARPREGFTLLELVGALGLLAILLAIALPRLSAELPRILLEQSTRRLAGDARFARVKSIGEGRRFRLVVDLGAGEWSVASDRGGAFVSEGVRRALPDGVRFDASASSRVAGGRISITFQPRGHTADNSTIAVAAGARSRRVIVSPAGRVRIQ